MKKMSKGRNNPQTVILDDHACYEEIGPVSVVNGQGQEEEWPKPRVPLFKKCEITLRALPAAKRVSVTTLLDTGTDITIVRPEKIDELGEELSLLVPVERKISMRGVLQPAHDLAFFFPQSDCPHSSRYGMISPLEWEFDIADVWIGQDLLNQLIVTLDAPRGVVTIRTPGSRAKSVSRKVALGTKQKARVARAQRGKEK